MHSWLDISLTIPSALSWEITETLNTLSWGSWATSFSETRRLYCVTSIFLTGMKDEKGTRRQSLVVQTKAIEARRVARNTIHADQKLVSYLVPNKATFQLRFLFILFSLQFWILRERVNTWNMIYLNCWGWDEDMKDRRSYLTTKAVVKLKPKKLGLTARSIMSSTFMTKKGMVEVKYNINIGL